MKMKTIMTKWAMLIALVTAFSCTETETGIEPEPGGGDGQVALGINPNLKVEAGMKSTTKSVVSGSTITYTDYNTAPGLGVVVTNSDATDWYSPDASSSGYTGPHVWYMGDAKGENWISITEKGLSYDPKNEKPYYLKETIGKVYAYYPYDVNALSSLLSINSESDLKIPITVIASGEMDASANNANKIWNATSWSANKNKGVSLSLTTEKDYLYFGADGGRYVNNGRADGFSPVTPEDEPNNLDTDNPGYKINLDMKHAMAMVSFRVYDGGRLSGNNVNFTKFTIKNHIGGTNLFKTGSGKMSLTDGAITETVATAELSRTITNYVLMRQVEAGEGQYAFIQTGTTTGGINGKTVSKSVSAIVYPVNFGENEIDLEITLKEGDNTPVVYPVTLAGNQWEPNNNYIYTLSAGRNKLTVMDVSVEAWADNEQDEIPL